MRKLTLRIAFLYWVALNLDQRYEKMHRELFFCRDFITAVKRFGYPLLNMCVWVYFLGWTFVDIISFYCFYEGNKFVVRMLNITVFICIPLTFICSLLFTVLIDIWINDHKKVNEKTTNFYSEIIIFLNIRWPLVCKKISFLLLQYVFGKPPLLLKIFILLLPKKQQKHTD